MLLPAGLDRTTLLRRTRPAGDACLPRWVCLKNYRGELHEKEGKKEVTSAWDHESVARLVALCTSSSSSLSSSSSSSSCTLSSFDDAAGEWGIFEEGPTLRCTPIKIEPTQGQVTLGSENFPESGLQLLVLSLSLSLSSCLTTAAVCHSVTSSDDQE